MEPLRTGLVGILPTGRSAEADLPAGGLDSTAHPEVLLATVAQRDGPGERAAAAWGAPPAAENGANRKGRVVHGEH
ncbi:MAG: hypothetical protein Q7W05_13305, partial [Deltaproteobacteria bacterium]|nr:hypothetical protein [Deltaproteobacteria bacterium]